VLTLVVFHGHSFSEAETLIQRQRELVEVRCNFFKAQGQSSTMAEIVRSID
jgi:hypothetical protein